MTNPVIDLGQELAGYGVQEPAPAGRPAQPAPRPAAGGRGYVLDLADLKAAGFNTRNPDAVTIAPSMIPWQSQLLEDLLGDVPIVAANTWHPGDPVIGIEPPPWLKLHTDEGGPDA